MIAFIPAFLESRPNRFYSELFDPLLALGNEMELLEECLFPQLLKVTSPTVVRDVPTISCLRHKSWVGLGEISEFFECSR